MKTTIRILAFVAIAVTSSYARPPGVPWKVFTNRAGWSISYPADWSIASCQSCKDPEAPNVFVSFFPPQMKTADGWVMVSPLASKPSDTSVDEWFTNIAKGANLNSHIAEQRLTLGGLPAFKVRYSTADGQEMEEVYVIAGARTFSISFSADPSARGTSLEKLPNYAIYVKMSDSFRAESR